MNDLSINNNGVIAVHSYENNYGILQETSSVISPSHFFYISQDKEITSSNNIDDNNCK